jgi:hypothetical protein
MEALFKLLSQILPSSQDIPREQGIQITNKALFSHQAIVLNDYVAEIVLWVQSIILASLYMLRDEANSVILIMYIIEEEEHH